MAPPHRPRFLKWVVSGLSNTTPVQRRPKQQRGGGHSPRKSLPRPLQPSRLELLPPPKAMGAAALGRAANAAARELSGSGEAFWEAVFARATELKDSLDPEDVSLLLNGMARAQQLQEEMLELLKQHALSRVAYFNAQHLAMVVNAIAKASQGPQELQPFLRELQDRVPEFQGSQELTMAITALARALVNDGELLEALSRRVETRFGPDQFHVRELAAICFAYTRLAFLDAVHIDRVLRRGIATAPEATPSELSQLVLAGARARADSTGEVAMLCASLAADKVHFMLPAEVVKTVFAFGHAIEHCPERPPGRQDLINGAVPSSKIQDQKRVRILQTAHQATAAATPMQPLTERGVDVLELLAMAVHACARAPDHFQVHQIVAVLHSCSRWAIPMEEQDFCNLLQAVKANAESLLVSSATKAIHSIARLLDQEVIVSKSELTGKASLPSSADSFDASGMGRLLSAQPDLAIAEGAGLAVELAKRLLLVSSGHLEVTPHQLSQTIAAIYSIQRLAKGGREEDVLEALVEKLVEGPERDETAMSSLKARLLGLGASNEHPLLRRLDAP